MPDDQAADSQTLDSQTADDQATTPRRSSSTVRRQRRRARQLHEARLHLQMLERMTGTVFAGSAQQMDGLREMISRGGVSRRELARQRRG